MRKRYYCDYCEKKLMGGIGIRKRHIEGLLHQKARTEHYVNFRDLKTVIKEEKAKTTCSRILQNKPCTFGYMCRFSHYTPQEIWELEHQDYLEDHEKWIKSQPKIEDFDVKEFLKKRNEKISREKIEFKPFWTYKFDCLKQEHLPPSMRELDPSQLTNKYEEWG